jgi:hypothetical protein
MRTQRCVFGAIGGLALAAAMAASAQAVVIGATANFQDMTLQGWEGAGPTVVPNGGPTGAGDAYMSLTSIGGNGPESRLATDNGGTDWTGNYLTAGVTTVEADFLNLGAVPLSIRAVFFNGQVSRYTSKIASPLPVDGLWHHFVFAIDPTSVTQVIGTDPYNVLFSNMSSLMFRHQAGNPDFGGTPIASSMGVDNIRILPAPGAGAGLLLAAGIGAMRRRRGAKA